MTLGLIAAGEGSRLKNQKLTESIKRTWPTNFPAVLPLLPEPDKRALSLTMTIVISPASLSKIDNPQFSNLYL